MQRVEKKTKDKLLDEIEENNSRHYFKHLVCILTSKGFLKQTQEQERIENSNTIIRKHKNIPNWQKIN